MSLRWWLLLVVVPVTAAAQEARPSPALDAVRVPSGTVQLDGRLDEAVWRDAALATGFTQQSPEAGQPASERTEARVLVGPSALYVGMRLHDTQPDAIDARLARRDSDETTDIASVMIDSYDDDRTAFAFRVTPAGVKQDLLLFDDIRSDASWDAVWDVATSRDSGGWTAEFRIPLSQLRFAGGDGPHRWGLQFGRTHFRTGEVAHWAPLLPSVFGTVSRFGTLRLPGPMQAPQAIEILPYIASSVTRAPGDAADPFYRTADASPSAGVDLKVGLTSDLRLMGTINPDFGQVEADPAQINLTAYELFFPERRPFFVEGLDVFNYGRTRAYFNNNRPLFLYTRRIGRAPQRGGFVPASAYDLAGETGAVYTDRPVQTTILGATKMTGRVGAFTIGVLDAVTAPEYGRFAVVDANGGEQLADRQILEPASNYLVARTRGRFGATQVGGIVTGVSRARGDDALVALLPNQEWVVGVDGEHALSDSWIVSGLASGSLVTGTEASILGLQTAFRRLYQRVGADHLAVDSARTVLSGTTAEVALSKVSGAHWRGSISAAYTSPGFESNALGFQTRADQNYVGVSVFYDETEPSRPFRRWTANLFGSLGYSMGWDRTHSFIGWGLGADFDSFWSARFTGFANIRTVNDRIARGGPLWTDPAAAQGTLSVNSDSRRPLRLDAFVNGGADEIGGGFGGSGMTLSGRPTSSLSLSIGPSITRTVAPYQYVTAFEDPAAIATAGTRYVFGRIDRVDATLETRVDWTFSPDVSLQLYLRPLVSTGRYTDYRELDRPLAMDLPVYGVDKGTATLNGDGTTVIDPGDGGAPFTLSDNDFTFRSLQGNAVLRWEYRPGSTLFLVWQQQRSGYFVNDGVFRGRNAPQLFTDPGQNVFLVKLSYWFAR
ncbi:MAG: DUF5916 domain-containing protein [Bacteroidota bacterium]